MANKEVLINIGLRSVAFYNKSVFFFNEEKLEKPIFENINIKIYPGEITSILCQDIDKAKTLAKIINYSFDFDNNIVLFNNRFYKDKITLKWLSEKETSRLNVKNNNDEYLNVKNNIPFVLILSKPIAEKSINDQRSIIEYLQEFINNSKNSETILRSIIVITSDIPEAFVLSDRIYTITNDDQLKEMTLDSRYRYVDRFDKYVEFSLGISDKRKEIEESYFVLTEDFHDSDLFTKDKRYFIELLNYIKVQSIKAAVSQAMVRNMSHNHGSHLLTKLIDPTKLSGLDKDTLKALLSNSDNNCNFDDCKKLIQGVCEFIVKSPSDINIKEDNVSYFSSFNDITLELVDQTLVGQIAILNKYIKGRMDFLSEVTFEAASMLTSLNFYKDVLVEFDKNRLLLNYISGVDNFPYTIVCEENGIELSEKHDIEIAFPSNILGVQALYNIFEAIIRNSAKYSPLVKNSTVFKVEIKEIPEISSNKEICNRFIILEVCDGIKQANIEKLVSKQNKFINNSVLENNKLRSNALGLLEMKACAAFLRQIDVSEIDSSAFDANADDQILLNKNGNFPLLQAIKRDDALAYRFYLKKPEEFLLIGQWDISESRKVELLKIGLRIMPIEEFKEQLMKNTRFNYQFVLYDDSIDTDYLENENILVKSILECDRTIRNVLKYLPLLPARILNVSDKKRDIISVLESNVFEFAIFEKKIWDLWDNKNQISYSAKIISASDLSPTNDDTLDYYLLLDHDSKNNYLEKSKSIKYIEPLNSAVRKYLPEFIKCDQLNHFIKNICEPDIDLILAKKIAVVYCGLDESELKGIMSKPDLLTKLPADKRNTYKEKDIEFRQKTEEEKLQFLEGEIKYSNIVKIKLLEAFKTRCIVIDERVQDYASCNCIDKIFDNINILLPKKADIDFSHKNLSENIKIELLNGSENYTNKIEEYVGNAFHENKVEKSSNEISFLLVHYGILERIYPDKTDIINLLSKWANSTRVIVTSGRGRHSLELPEEVCYINLSPVSNVLIENRCKYTFNYLLNQSRK